MYGVNGTEHARFVPVQTNQILELARERFAVNTKMIKIFKQSKIRGNALIDRTVRKFYVNNTVGCHATDGSHSLLY